MGGDGAEVALRGKHPVLVATSSNNMFSIPIHKNPEHYKQEMASGEN